MSSVSRREFFSAFSRPFSRRAHEGEASPVPDNKPTDRIAVIQGRYCLALTSFCSTCTERCPVPGAMKKERGLPVVVADVCTGCGICQEVCPAPRNAVLMIPHRPSPSYTSA